MKDGKQNKSKILFLSLSLIFSLMLCSCVEEENTIEETPPTTEQTIEKFVITETKDGQIKTILEAESAIIDEDNKTAKLKLPKVKFYDDGKYKSILIAESGEINMENNSVKAFGKCTVETVDNEYLQTRDVSYDAKKQLIYSDSDIKITKDKDVMYGKGFESDINLKNIVIKKQRIIID
ncbi:LPS export ABC transporter periplasmic protein LptC [Candidatus Ruminimicrobiellum ovillum]|uniref:LPS export ABC transporter periplasmic protein LptC n=1 Tax=Candidatus Ruminimicrobiellum ovillum TaxID=1947927 RepID=UPI00355AAD28